MCTLSLEDAYRALAEVPLIRHAPINGTRPFGKSTLCRELSIRLVVRTVVLSLFIKNRLLINVRLRGSPAPQGRRQAACTLVACTAAASPRARATPSVDFPNVEVKEAWPVVEAVVVEGFRRARRIRSEPQALSPF